MSGAPTAVVTGAGSGIGRATADRLRADGYQVLGVDLRAAGPDVVQADVTDLASLEAASARLGDAPVDALVLAAGIWSPRDDRYTCVALDVWDRTWAVNVTGTMLSLRAFAPRSSRWCWRCSTRPPPTSTARSSRSTAASRPARPSYRSRPGAEADRSWTPPAGPAARCGPGAADSGRVPSWCRPTTTTVPSGRVVATADRSVHPQCDLARERLPARHVLDAHVASTVLTDRPHVGRRVSPPATTDPYGPSSDLGRAPGSGPHGEETT